MGRGAPADFAASTVMVTGMGAGGAGVWERKIERPVSAKRKARNDGFSGDFIGR
jgi:hypothetical protein